MEKLSEKLKNAALTVLRPPYHLFLKVKVALKCGLHDAKHFVTMKARRLKAKIRNLVRKTRKLKKIRNTIRKKSRQQYRSAVKNIRVLKKKNLFHRFGRKCIRGGRKCRRFAIHLGRTVKEKGFKALPSEISKIFRDYRAGRKEAREKAWALVPQEEFAAQTDQGFIDRIGSLLEALPQSNGGRYYTAHRQRIGIVADEFMYDSIKAAADFVFLPPENWEPLIDGLDLLLMVSAWKGIGEEWRGAAKEGDEKRETLYRIIEACKSRGIPTVFYSKEDPPNYDYFVGLAKQCDLIFTTCLEVTDKYRADCGNDNVQVLQFGINPLFHNPVGMRSEGKQDGVVFSGSWMDKYPERQADMRMLLGGAMASGKFLKIIDRNFDRQPAVRYRYPPEFWQYLSPAVAHDVLQNLHKLYDWALNINTVKTSRTMFANRGYELQGCGILLVSNYSCGVNEQLPTVFICQDTDEVSGLLTALTPEEIYERQIAGIREMMTGNTCFDRVGQILDQAGLKKETNERKALVIAEAKTAHIREMFERQRYPHKELLTADELTPERYEGADVIAFFSDEMEYEMFYLEDMINAFKYTDCDYITKDAWWDGTSLHSGIEHDYVSVMKSKYRTVFWRASFEKEKLLALDGSEELPNGYGADHFNYCGKVWNGVERTAPDGKASVVIPVNAGESLVAYAKAFASLRRGSLFERLDVVFAVLPEANRQDGDYCDYLARRYGNARVVRVKSVAEAVSALSSAYCTVLSAGNEAIHDGIRLMLEKAEIGSADMVFGEILVCGGGERQKLETVDALQKGRILGSSRKQHRISQLSGQWLDINGCLLRPSLAAAWTSDADLKASLAAAGNVQAVRQTVTAVYVI